MQRRTLGPCVLGLILATSSAGCSIDAAGSGTDEGLEGGVLPVDSALADTNEGLDGGLTPHDTAIADEGFDAASTDTAVADTTSIDSRVVDSGIDTAPIDSGVDTAPIDSGIDTAPIDSGVDTTPPPDTAIPCPEAGALRYGGHCYFLLSTGRTYVEARDACAATSPAAHLVAITSDGEEKAVGPLIGTGDAWIGLSRPGSSPSRKSSFSWITGEATSYDAWAGGEPNGSGPCGRLRPPGQWADQDCSTKIAALCERE